MSSRPKALSGDMPMSQRQSANKAKKGEQEQAGRSKLQGEPLLVDLGAV